MSVLKYRRNLSELEFYNNSKKLRKEVTLYLLKDFGIKDKIRNYKNDKTGDTNRIIEVFPEWIIDYFRNSVMDLLRNLNHNITAANSIYPNNETEFYQRRCFQNAAIGNCEQLLQEMQYILDVIPVDVNRILRYTNTIEREIILLKGWRKSDNKILKRLKEH